MSVEIFIAVFALLTLSELGDKTQLAIITLTARSKKPLIVFMAAMTGFILVNGLGVLTGQLLVLFTPYFIIRLVTGLMFIAFGTLFLIKSRKTSDEPCNEKTMAKQHSSLFLTAFSFVSLAELGDKTQIITILLVANYHHFQLIVFLGVLAGLALVSGIGVLLGGSCSRVISPKKLHMVSGILFIAFGALTILGLV